MQSNQCPVKEDRHMKKLLPLLLAAALAAGCTSSAPIQEPVASTANPAASTITSDLAADQTDDGTWQAEGATAIQLKGNTAALQGYGASLDGNLIYILAPGTYVISGSMENGQIIVDSQGKGNVRLVLNGATIQSKESAPIYVRNADKAIITLAEGTQNLVSDGQSYKLPAGEDEPNAAIFSKDDLTINGQGALTVRAHYNNGIMSKDDLRITGGTLSVTAVDDGLVGRDRVIVRDGTITVEAGGDAIKTTNESDPAKGYVAVDGGTLRLKAGADGIQATTSVMINGGTIQVDAGDDGLNSSHQIAIVGGEITIAAKDDGIHADQSIVIQGGKIAITQSYEGIESKLITIAGGEISVVASDDGISVSDGTANASGGRPAPGAASASPYAIHIRGGVITVDAMGDGIDANGSIYMSDGTLFVHGTTANNNGAIDYDGVFEMTGGVLIAAGSSGMAQAPSPQSTNHAIAMTFTARAQQAGTTVTLRDSSDKELLSFTPKRQFQSIVIASPAIKQGATYTLHAGGTKVVSFPVSSVITWVTETGVAAGPPGRGGIRR